MSPLHQSFLLFSVAVGIFNTLLTPVSAVELTFELADKAKDCFYEDIKEGTKSVFEFQVVTGGQYDVDVVIEGPGNHILYQGLKKQFDNFPWTASRTGTHSFCFSNEFSSFTHKLIYFDLQVGEEQPLPGIPEHATAMTKMEQATVNVHDHLNSIIDAQTHYRLNEAKGRKRAEDLNQRVMFWSIGESFLVLVVTIGQVVILRNFFTDKKATIAST